MPWRRQVTLRREIEWNPTRDSNIYAVRYLRSANSFNSYSNVFFLRCAIAVENEMYISIVCSPAPPPFRFVDCIVLFFLKMNLSFVIMIDWLNLNLNLLKLSRVCAAQTVSLFFIFDERVGGAHLALDYYL